MARLRIVSYGWTIPQQERLDAYLLRAARAKDGGLPARLAAGATRLVTAAVRGIARVPRGARSDGSPTPVSVLVVRLDELGDVILGSPLFDALRRAWPSARITLVAQPAAAAVYRGHSALDEVITFRPPRAKWLRPFAMPILAAHFARRALGPTDVAIQPRWGVDANFAAWLVYFSGAPRRIGFGSRGVPRKRVLNAGLDALYTDVIDGPAVLPEAERVNEILHALGLPATDLRPDTATTAATSAPTQLRSDATRIAVGVGGGHSDLKIWPPRRFGELMLALAATCDAQFVLLGDPSERALADEAVHAAGGADVVDLVGRTTLGEAAAVLDAATLFVGNDTGLLHLAAARGVRSVGVFGSSLPAIFAPAGDVHVAVWNSVPCNPYARAVAITGSEPPPELSEGERCATCVVQTHACMRELPVAEVLAACAEQLHAAE